MPEAEFLFNLLSFKVGNKYALISLIILTTVRTEYNSSAYGHEWKAFLYAMLQLYGSQCPLKCSGRIGTSLWNFQGYRKQAG